MGALQLQLDVFSTPGVGGKIKSTRIPAGKHKLYLSFLLKKGHPTSILEAPAAVTSGNVIFLAELGSC